MNREMDMKYHLMNLELHIDEGGKTGYRHKEKKVRGRRVRTLCGEKTDNGVEMSRWLELKQSNPGWLCEHCKDSLGKKRREIKA